MAHAPLVIRLTKRPDGAVVFELRRADGTTTWQKRAGLTTDFFAIHDLTHFAVETELAFGRAFYGLVADGWDLSDFGTPWPRGPLPPEALPPEVIIGRLDTARASGAPLTAEDCNASAVAYFASSGMPSSVSVTDEALDRVRGRLSELVWRWHGLDPRETLELIFPA